MLNHLTKSSLVIAWPLVDRRQVKVLMNFSKCLNFKDVNSARYREEAIRDEFISGLQSAHIRQRLLQNRTLDLSTMFDQARALDTAQKNSELYSVPVDSSVNCPWAQEYMRGFICLRSSSDIRQLSIVSVSSAVIPSIQGQNALLVMLYATSFRRRDIMLRSVGHRKDLLVLHQLQLIVQP